MASAVPVPLASLKLGVIGAGAAGLVAAREFQREGHKVVVFERESQIGGTWVYTPQVEPDLLGLDPDRPIVQSSLYSSLRTNLPRELMGFSDFPFLLAKDHDQTRDARRYPGHREVLLYLQEFAREFEIEKMVRFETEVVNVVRTKDDNKWKVSWRQRTGFGDLHVVEEIYDAVVVCNGHNTQPRLAEIRGASSWPGKQMHSHNYRTPQPFQDQVVVLIGSSWSAMDISREIAGIAKEVHVASRSVAEETYERQPGPDNMWLHSMIDSLLEDGSVAFRNGRVIKADVIMHCTGYDYHFPFLDLDGILTVDDNRVGPLYKHVFPPVVAPGLSFVGLPWRALVFLMFELQSKWIAGVLSGRIELPSQEEMMEDVEGFYLALEASNIPKRYTHRLGASQLEYFNWLAAQCGHPGVGEWRKKMYHAFVENVKIRPDTYRDEWQDDHLVSEAHSDMRTHVTSKLRTC